MRWKKKKSGRMLLISLSYPFGSLGRRGFSMAGRVLRSQREVSREILSPRMDVCSSHGGSYEEHRVGRTPATLRGRLSHPGSVAAWDRSCCPECSREKYMKQPVSIWKCILTCSGHYSLCFICAVVIMLSDSGHDTHKESILKGNFHECVWIWPRLWKMCPS